jgi:hypothetical protein
MLRTEPNGQLAGVLLKVVEDTPEVYNLLVCTLCSCYPISVLGARALLVSPCPYHALHQAPQCQPPLPVWAGHSPASPTSGL